MRLQTITFHEHPAVTYYTGNLFYQVRADSFKCYRLTFAGLLRGVGGNFLRMSYWRLMVTLRILGFLTTEEGAVLRWRHFTLRFWRHQMWRRLRIVKLARRVGRRA
jgi:hypothetical protein